MPILPSNPDAFSWSKNHRQAQWNINAVINEENDTLVRPTFEGVAKTSNITYNFDVDLAYVHKHEHSPSCEDIMVVVESYTPEQRAYKAKLQYEYYNYEYFSDEPDHGCFSDEPVSGGENAIRAPGLSRSSQAPGFSQSSIPAHDAKAEPWCLQCLDCEPKCSPLSVDSDTPYGSHGFNCNRVYEACRWGS